ncbi:hypothetical protein A3Q56_01774 [Intoshia linei]|uniref:Uncharacterized protein n=1 Tax=Intoshia linei TaxID=1819745 RepID=A0A177B878_9BILA|nr:hypothetical protein A3Q56_01774 [Intoshia linei]
MKKSKFKHIAAALTPKASAFIGLPNMIDRRKFTGVESKRGEEPQSLNTSFLKAISFQEIKEKIESIYDSDTTIYDYAETNMHDLNQHTLIAEPCNVEPNNENINQSKIYSYLENAIKRYEKHLFDTDTNSNINEVSDIMYQTLKLCLDCFDGILVPQTNKNEKIVFQQLHNENGKLRVMISRLSFEISQLTSQKYIIPDGPFHKSKVDIAVLQINNIYDERIQKMTKILMDYKYKFNKNCKILTQVLKKVENYERSIINEFSKLYMENMALKDEIRKLSKSSP